MSKFTDFLNLFKWDPVEDAEEEFNIEKSLNENWDKIDTKLKTYITTLQANKVDKEDGKNLSTNDYTNKEKEKLNNIESNAQVNLIEKIQKNGIDIDIINKIVNLILTKNDVGLDNVDNTSDIDKPLSNAVITELTKKLDKTSKATSTEAIAGTNNTKYTTPYTVKSAIDKALEGYTPSGGGGGGDTLPIGAILPFSSDAIPNGWLLCDGRAVSRTEYAELFKAIGLSYVEEGYEWQDEERFPLPNGKGRTLVGKDSTDTDFNELGKTGGEKTHTLTKSELPKIDIQTKFASSSGGDGSGLVYGTSTGSSPNNLVYNVNYGSQAHNNLQPYLAENFIIKAKNTVVVKGDVIQETDTASENNTYSAKAIDNKLKTNIVIGKEVATNEYEGGKQVFIKKIDIGSLPNATRKTVETGLSNVKVIKLHGIARDSSLQIPLPFVYPELPSCIGIMFVNGSLYVNTGSDRTGLTGEITIYYTKNT